MAANFWRGGSRQRFEASLAARGAQLPVADAKSEARPAFWSEPRRFAPRNLFISQLAQGAAVRPKGREPKGRENGNRF